MENVPVNYEQMNASVIEGLKKKYKFFTEITNKTDGANKTYYTIYKNVVVSGPIEYKSGQNLIGLVVFSIAVGLVTASLGEEGKPLLSFVDTLNKIISRLVHFVMW